MYHHPDLLDFLTDTDCGSSSDFEPEAQQSSPEDSATNQTQETDHADKEKPNASSRNDAEMNAKFRARMSEIDRRMYQHILSNSSIPLFANANEGVPNVSCDWQAPLNTVSDDSAEETELEYQADLNAITSSDEAHVANAKPSNGSSKNQLFFSATTRMCVDGKHVTDEAMAQRLARGRKC